MRASVFQGEFKNSQQKFPGCFYKILFRWRNEELFLKGKWPQSVWAYGKVGKIQKAIITFN